MARKAEIVAVLTDAGMNATGDPRSATPPCVLVGPPRRENDLNCGYTAEWVLWALVPNPFNADSEVVLDGLVDQLEDLLPVRRSEPSAYNLSPDNPPFPAYRVELHSEGIAR
jgi:hypothetical protein